MFAQLNQITLFSGIIELEFARIALISTILVSLICGCLSPLIVIKERAYVGDTLAHYVFPGLVGGYLFADIFQISQWGGFFVGALLSSLLGSYSAEFLHRRLKIPQDAASVVALTGFFGLGVVAVSRFRGTRVDLDRILFGDILTLTWIDVGVLFAVLIFVLLSLVTLHKHWDAWLSDPEFAEIAGFKTHLVNRLFVILVSLSVLSGLFAVGGLMISALLTLPAVLTRPHSVLSFKTIGTSLLLGFVGLVFAFQFDWPVGSTIVVTGFISTFLLALIK